MEIKKSKLKLSKNLILLLLAFTVIFAGCKKDSYTYIQTDSSLPTAKYSYTIDNLTVTFTNESSDATDYEWNFGDTFGSGDVNPEHQYTAKGIYTVVLTAIDGNGETSEMSIDIPVGFPLASFTYVVDMKEVTFTNTSANATTYEWDFGDGNTSTEENPVHTYADVDTYTVTLKAIDGTDENSYIEDVNTLGKLEVVIIDWDMNVDTDGWSTVHCGFANSGDSYDLDDGIGQSTKINDDDNASGDGDHIYQVVDISPNSDYNFSFWVYQKHVGGTDGETGAVVGTIETVVNGGADPGVVLATVTTTATANKIWNNFNTNFNTGANSQVVIRLYYDYDSIATGQTEARVDYVEIF